MHLLLQPRPERKGSIRDASSCEDAAELRVFERRGGGEADIAVKVMNSLKL